MPANVYFIIKGQVFFTNESGTFHYFKLGAGSYFGDINILLDHPSSYSVQYDNYIFILSFSFDENAEPVLILAVKREKFLKICDKFPDSKRVLVEMAKKRRKQFKIVIYIFLIYIAQSKIFGQIDEGADKEFRLEFQKNSSYGSKLL